LEGVRKVIGARTLLKGATLTFNHGAKIGVVGVNGSGKSSLLRIIAGVDAEFEGRVAPLVSPLKIGFLEQEPRIDESKTVGEVVYEGVQSKRALLMEYERVLADFAHPDADHDELVRRQSELVAQIEEQRLWDLDQRVQTALEALRCPPASSPTRTLSGGERRRVALCRLLISEPDMLM
jgi:ATPase subunit of ABC transporter with duplicated ATPase domains